MLSAPTSTESCASRRWITGASCAAGLRARGVERRGLRSRALGEHGGEGGEHTVVRGDPRERRIDDGGRAGAAVTDGRRDLARMRPGGVHHTSRNFVFGG